MVNFKNMKSEVILFLVGLALLGLLVFLAWFFIFKVKHLKPNDLYMVDGGVKTGKSLICVMLTVKNYRKAIIKYYIGNVLVRFINLFKKLKKKKMLDKLEKPMLYSNMPLYRTKFNYLTLDVIFGRVRIPHGSVCLLDEATLLADSMLGMVTEKDKKARFDEVNEALTLFLKTFGHMTHGGKLFYNSQNVIDLHFAFKRNTSVYLYVTKTRKYPFFCLSDVREVIHDEAGDIVNVVTRDVAEDNRPLFVSKRWYKYYDRYYLDVLTKNLPLYVNYDVQKLDKRKGRVEVPQILTLGTYKRIEQYNTKKILKRKFFKRGK